EEGPDLSTLSVTRDGCRHRRQVRVEGGRERKASGVFFVDVFRSRPPSTRTARLSPGPQPSRVTDRYFFTIFTAFIVLHVEGSIASTAESAVLEAYAARSAVRGSIRAARLAGR